MRLTIGIGVFTALLLACTGTDVGNPVVDLDFSVHKSEETRAARQQILASTVGVRFEEAWVVVDRIRMREGSDCSGEAQFELVGPYFVDLFGQGTLPALRDIEVPGDEFCRFEFRWRAEDQVPADAPEALAEASLLLAGTRGDGVPFVLRSRRNDEFRLDARDTSFRLSDATGTLFVSFDTELLFAGIELGAAELGDDGIVTIDEDNNRELLDIFDDNLAAATKLFDDNDNNGELDGDESTDEEVLAE